MHYRFCFWHIALSPTLIHAKWFSSTRSACLFRSATLCSISIFYFHAASMLLFHCLCCYDIYYHLLQIIWDLWLYQPSSGQFSVVLWHWCCRSSLTPTCVEPNALCWYRRDNYFNFCQAVCFVDYFPHTPAPTTHTCIVAPCRLIWHQINFLVIATKFTTTSGTILLRCLCSAAFSHFHNNSLPLVYYHLHFLCSAALSLSQQFTTTCCTILCIAYAPRLWATITRSLSLSINTKYLTISVNHSHLLCLAFHSLFNL